MILKTGNPPELARTRHGHFDVWIARGIGCAPNALRVVDVHGGEALPPLDEISGIIVTGSPEMVTARPEWSESSARWLAEIVEQDALPVLGLCYGHQLIAHGLGGEVDLNPKGREIGTQAIQFEANAVAADPLFEAGIFPGQMSHSESVLRPPTDAQVLATTAIEGHAALRFGPRQWGVQFHPEFDRAIMRAYLEARQDVLAEEGFDVPAVLEAVVESPELAKVLTRFAAFAAEASA